ncbi:MAG TPA: ankyrin repeat domain-containing protein [Bryobacteraceae bacterium]|nr:ankyrin repeat domain-containing protein [Bryobacteraceae bacterium]
MRQFVLPVAALAIAATIYAGGLQVAAKAGDLPKVPELLKAGDPIDGVGELGRTALLEAVANGRVDIVRTLLLAGANASKPDADGHAARWFAHELRDAGERSTISLLLDLRGGEKEDNPWTLQYAASHGQTSVVEMRLKMGANPNLPGAGGNRALEIACLKGNEPIVELLLQHGADPKLRTPAGSTALHDAALSGGRRIGEMLLAHGAQIDAKDADLGATPLYVAAAFGQADFAKMLIGHGASTKIVTKSGKSVLQAARESRLAEIVALCSDATR